MHRENNDERKYAGAYDVAPDSIELKEAEQQVENEDFDLEVPANSSSAEPTQQPKQKRTFSIKKPAVFRGFFGTLVLVYILTGIVSACLNGSGWSEVPFLQISPYNLYTIGYYVPFFVYLNRCYLRLAEAFNERLGDPPAASMSFINLITLTSMLLLPELYAYTSTLFDGWSLRLALGSFLLVQLILPFKFFRAIGKRNFYSGKTAGIEFVVPFIALVEFAVFQTSVTGVWYITQLILLKVMWNQLIGKEAKDKSPKNLVTGAGSDRVIQYHPFAAFSRWQKQQEAAINKEFKAIFFIAIPIILFCFYYSFGFISALEREADLMRTKAAVMEQEGDDLSKADQYKERLAARMKSLKHQHPAFSNYRAIFSLNNYGQIHGQVRLLQTYAPASLTNAEIARALDAEAILRQAIQDEAPFPPPDVHLTHGNILPVEIDFSKSPPFDAGGVEVTLNLPDAGASLRRLNRRPSALPAIVVPKAEREASRSFLDYLGLAIVGTLVGLFALITSKPTHIGVNPDGWRYLWRRGLNRFNGKYLKWNEISQIYMAKAKNSTSPLDDDLCFRNHKGKIKRISMGSIESIEDREMLQKAIQKWAPHVSCDASVFTALQPPANHSYTELWLQALSAPPKRERLKPLQDATQLRNGKYTVLEEIGAGGLGHAYLALDQDGGTVVLKECILPVYVDVSVRRTSLEQFENEARLLRQIDHPQIVKLIDFFVEDHRTYLVLEHIDGRSLRQLVKDKGAMSESEVRGLSAQMCEILNCLHNMNPPVIHRDFTPDNLILKKDGTLKLIDFNVAKQVVESTTSGTVVGKHAYLPPEQFRGMPERASDIYAMGATIHYLLCGQDPEPISTSHPKRIKPEISEAINKLVERATALDLAKRYSNINNLKMDLESEQLQES